MCQLDEHSDVQWLKNNKPLDDKFADRVIMSEGNDSTYTLEIQHCRESDSGSYTARAINGTENAACTAQLIVEKREYIITPVKGVGLINTTRFFFNFSHFGTKKSYVRIQRTGVQRTAEGYRGC